jgi:DNA repair exonuclease SbcCD ATPase subunit/DNA repair exonuclease SbcCD nuclease subunit
MRINVPFTKLRHVCHIADIHVRLFRRHEEYELAFEQLYADLQQKQLQDYVIVLAGDIVHAKTDMSPELVAVTSRFLTNIANFAPTILIAGNHDCNLANTSRLDALTPIVNALQHPNLHYVRDSALVDVADTTFAVCSIFDEPTQWPTPTEIADNRTKIALYHGPVHGATTDANFVITNRHVRIDTFNGFDMVMLGDIHRLQTLQEYNPVKRKPIIQFAGSLIQQNFGETLENHGWCLWDVPNKSFEFVPLHNAFGYVTLEVINDRIAYPANMPQNARVRLFTGDLEHTKVKKLITTLRKKYNIIELSVNKSRLASAPSRPTDVKHGTLDLQNISTQNVLINDWLSRNHSPLDATMLTAIERVNTEMNGKIVHEDHSRNIHWRPLKFTFSNMFSYGENNQIDFSQMNGVYGLFAANASGKSSVIDSLIFCLYDKTPRAFKGDHIINNRKDTFECQLLFEINHETFGIKRTGTRKKNGDVKVDVTFWKELGNGNRLNLSGEDRRDTNVNIRSYVGTYEDFIMTALSSQNSNALFIDKSHSERKDLLIQFMGLNVFDKLFDAAHDESREIAGILKRFKKSDVTDQLVTVTEELTQAVHTMASVEQEKDYYETLLASAEETFQLEHAKKRPVPPIMGSWNTLQSSLANEQTLLTRVTQTVATVSQSLADLHAQEVVTLHELSMFDVEQLKSAVQECDRLHTAWTKQKADLQVVQTQLTEKQRFKETLLTYTYNPSCDVCVTNNAAVIVDLEKVTIELNTLSARKNEREVLIANTQAQLLPLETARQEYTIVENLRRQLHEIDRQKNVLNTKLSSVTLEQQQITLRIEQLHADIATYKINEENITFNHEVDNLLISIQTEITRCKQRLQVVEKTLRDIHGKTSVLRAKKTELQQKLQEAEDLEATYDAFNYYMEAVGRDGVPYELMAKALPTIESEVNNILSQIVDFTVTLEVDGKNINGKLNYDYDRIWPLENSSGMERFISGLAIRVALINVSNLPKPNFLIADEGFGVLDAEHMGTVQTLLNVFKSHFDFILIVSHLDIMRDVVDHHIGIKKEDGYSCVSV